MSLLILNGNSENTFRKEKQIRHFHQILWNTVFRTKGGIWRGGYLKKHNLLHYCGDNLWFESRHMQ